MHSTELNKKFNKFNANFLQKKNIFRVVCNLNKILFQLLTSIQIKTEYD